MNTPQESISSRLKRAMAAANKKQADLVRETGLDRSAISNYLSGSYEPKQKAVFKLALALNVSEAWLLGYDVPMDRSEESKKNDQLVELVSRLRRDDNFLQAVSALAELDETQFMAVTQLLGTMKK